MPWAFSPCKKPLSKYCNQHCNEPYSGGAFKLGENYDYTRPKNNHPSKDNHK